MENDEPKNDGADIEEMVGTLESMAAETGRSRQAAGGAVPDVVAGWLAPRYVMLLREDWAAQRDRSERRKLLREAVGDVLLLQRGSAWSARLQMKREELEFQRQKHRDRMEAEKAAEVKRRDPNQPMTDEELKACVDKVDEIFGLKPARPREPMPSTQAILNQ